MNAIETTKLSASNSPCHLTNLLRWNPQSVQSLKAQGIKQFTFELEMLEEGYAVWLLALAFFRMRSGESSRDLMHDLHKGVITTSQRQSVRYRATASPFPLQLPLQLAPYLDVGEDGLSSPPLLALGGAGLARPLRSIPLPGDLPPHRVLYQATVSLLSQRRRLRGGSLSRLHPHPEWSGVEVAATSPALSLGAAGHFGPTPPRDNWLTH